MHNTLRSGPDVVIRTEAWDKARHFYGSVLGLRVAHEGDALVGYDTGSFNLYIEKGGAHGPVFEFLVPEVEPAKRVLLLAGCSVVEEDASVPRCYLRDPYGMVFNLRAEPARP
jgi:catechol 2,3-dioxygenase-like lactoylglutathione lyase family enzyme